MTQNRIEFLPHKTSTLAQIYRERFLDWIEAGEVISRKAAAYKTEYRKKICASCSEEEQAKRKCVKYVIDGKKLTSCGHMDSACGKMFKDEFNEYMSRHPAVWGRGKFKDAEKIQS